MPDLTPEEVAALVGKLQKFAYLCNVGTVSLGPLAAAPTVVPDVATADVTLYETLGSVEAKLLTKNDLTLTINTRNVDDGMALQGEIVKGQDLLDPARKKVITLVPITGSTAAKTITFENAYLQAGLNYAPQEGGQPNTMTLTYTCKAGTSGKAFTYG